MTEDFALPALTWRSDNNGGLDLMIGALVVGSVIPSAERWLCRLYSSNQEYKTRPTRAAAQAAVEARVRGALG